jgi:hypothetical protein
VSKLWGPSSLIVPCFGITCNLNCTDGEGLSCAHLNIQCTKNPGVRGLRPPQLLSSRRLLLIRIRVKAVLACRRFSSSVNGSPICAGTSASPSCSSIAMLIIGLLGWPVEDRQRRMIMVHRRSRFMFSQQQQLLLIIMDQTLPAWEQITAPFQKFSILLKTSVKTLRSQTLLTLCFGSYLT